VWHRTDCRNVLLRPANTLSRPVCLIACSTHMQTEIARRLAKLAGAPFIKVEATKYTEVGFHGKDVDTMIKVRTV